MEIKKFVFIIDHEGMNIFPLNMAITELQNGIGLYYAYSRQEAFEKIPSLWFVPDLIILNHNLPQTNALLILKQLKLHSTLKKIPVLLNNVSGVPMVVKDTEKARALGVADICAVPSVYANTPGLKEYLNKITAIVYKGE